MEGALGGGSNSAQKDIRKRVVNSTGNTYKTDARAASRWEDLRTSVHQDLPVAGFLGNLLLGNGGRSNVKFDTGSNFGGLALDNDRLAEDTSGSSEIRAPSVGTGNEVGPVYRDVLRFELLERGDNFDRVGAGDERRKSGQI